MTATVRELISSVLSSNKPFFFTTIQGIDQEERVGMHFVRVWSFWEVAWTFADNAEVTLAKSEGLMLFFRSLEIVFSEDPE